MDLTPGLFACFFVVLACACGKGSNGNAVRPPPDPADEPRAAPAPEQAPAAPAESVYDTNGLMRVNRDVDIFVGWLRRNASEDMMRPAEYCLEDGMLWQGAPFRLGRVNVIGLPLDLSDVALGKPVAVFGKREPSLDAALERVGACPEGYGAEAERTQMRSDWVADEGGFRTTHAKLAKTPYIRATGHDIVRLHQDLGKDDRLTHVRLFNPFDEDLSELEVQFHYEGGPTKPMPTFAERTLALASGESVDMEVPRTPTGKPISRSDKRAERLVGIRLRARVGRAEIDVEIPIS